MPADPAPFPHPGFAAVIHDPGYAGLKARLIAATGLAYYEDNDEELARILDQRLEHLGLTCLSDYTSMLEGNEWEDLMAEMTIGETYFFRHKEMFEALRLTVLPQLLDSNAETKTLRIWSAGCANGAEAYSVAILLDRYFREQIEGWQVSILASDINTRLLATAEEGLFRSWAFRAIDAGIRKTYFSPEKGFLRLSGDIRRMVRFLPHNLAVDALPWPTEGLAGLDLILCRNVLIYFDPATRERVVGGLYGALNEGGWLLVGHAEPNQVLFRSFCAHIAPGAVLYQRLDTSDPAGQPGRSQIIPRNRPLDGRPVRSRAVPPPLPTPTQAAAPVLDMARTGDWEAARTTCLALLSAAPLDPWVHFARALVHEHDGELAACEKELRRSLYLDRRLLLGHYRLGLLLMAMGRARDATRSFRNISVLLKGHSDRTEVPGAEPMTVGQLRQYVEDRCRNLEEGLA